MRAIRSYQDGGSPFEMDRATERRLNKASRQADREQRRYDRLYQRALDLGTPSNPRFMSGAPNVTPEDFQTASPNFLERLMLMLSGGEGRPRTINRGRGRGMSTGGRRMLQRAVDLSCKNGGC